MTQRRKNRIRARKFLLTRPSRDVTETCNVKTGTCTISTHTSLAGRDLCTECALMAIVISTHTSLAGRDQTVTGLKKSQQQFLLTRPSRDVTKEWKIYLHFRKFLLTRPSRDVTNTGRLAKQETCISTHTSLAGRDSADGYDYNRVQISTHTSLAGRDLLWARCSGNCQYFYSHVPRGT